MAIEIEHKFLLANDDWREHIIRSSKYRQGYLSSQATSSIRIRISDEHAWLNIKSATIGTHRHEYEYEIPLPDANEIITILCRKPIIEKTRHFVIDDGNTWEIDEFEGGNRGLIIAEIELSEIGYDFFKTALDRQRKLPTTCVITITTLQSILTQSGVKTRIFH